MTEINAFNKKICIKHSLIDKPVSDSVVEKYSTYKISVLLTDGLAAIVGDKIFVGDKYDIFFFAPDEIHFGRFLRAGIHEYIDFYLPTDFFNGLNDDKSLKYFLDDREEGRINLIRTDNETKKRIASIISAVLDTNTTELEKFTSALRVVNLCQRLYIPEKQKGYLNTASPLVCRVLSYIDTHYAEKITLENISAEMGCSEAYLSRVFKAHTGTSIYRHITDVRISTAQKLLLEGESVTDTCFASGFDDCSNFIAAFKKITGVTPLKYKKTAQK